MADGFIRVPVDDFGKFVDTDQLVVGANTVQRQRVRISGAGATDLAPATVADGLLVNLGTNNDVTIAGVATAAGQLADGHNVTIDNVAASPVPGAITTTGDVLVKPGDSVNNAMRVNIVAGSAGATEFAEDAPAAGGEAGPAILGVRQDADTSPVSLTGDFHQLIFDNVGALKVHVKTSALPAGAATAAKQLANGHDVTIDNAGAGAAVNIQDGGNSITIDAASLPLPAGASTSALQLPDGHNVTIDNASGASAVNIQDGGNSITIDAASLPLPAGAATSAAQLADGHNVTIDNASGASAVNIQDGGNSITIDAASLPLPAGAATSALQLADGHNVTIDNASGASAVNIQDGGNTITVDGTVTANAGTGDRNVVGNVANDAVDSGNPVKQGFKAAQFAADPDTVSADKDRVDSISTPQGIQWVLGGHPNIITREYMTTAVQTNDDMIGAVAAGSHIVLTEIEVLVSDATSVTPQVRIGFGATVVPAEPASGASVAGVVLSHGGIASGSGVVRGSGAGAIAVGGDGEELRITNAVPTSGKITVIFSYYIATL